MTNIDIIYESEEMKYKVGNYFFNTLDEKLYILTCISDDNNCCLVACETGRRWSDSVRVKDIYNITKDELLYIFDNYDKLIKLIPVKNIEMQVEL